MYRTLVMFPKSAAPVEVEALISGIASLFKAAPGCLSITRSVDALMGPGAKAGEAGWILAADFATLDDAMAALHVPGFQGAKTATESFRASIFLFEFHEL